jgi:hypothetical protein
MIVENKVDKILIKSKNTPDSRKKEARGVISLKKTVL